MSTTASSDAQNDILSNAKLTASAAYLSVFLGLPVVGPIAILVFGNRSDRYVRFHALQALAIQGLVAILAMLQVAATAFATVASSFQFARVDGVGPVFVGAVSMLSIVSAAATFAGSLIGSLRAFAGADFRFPIAARIADSFANWKDQTG
jgi:uncharacterized membrane protein